MNRRKEGKRSEVLHSSLHELFSSQWVCREGVRRPGLGPGPGPGLDQDQDLVRRPGPGPGPGPEPGPGPGEETRTRTRTRTWTRTRRVQVHRKTLTASSNHVESLSRGDKRVCEGRKDPDHHARRSAPQRDPAGSGVRGPRSGVGGLSEEDGGARSRVPEPVQQINLETNQQILHLQHEDRFVGKKVRFSSKIVNFITMLLKNINLF